ncbi:MAG: NAD(P)H-dependent oxidoreductase [Planctomycetes bacterium]|nr:NAD(P)H-dependent oxidoreductase [Planctomycetota bacterium]
MTRPPRILAFAGSLRRDSLNKKLVRIAADGARAAGAEVTLVDLKELPLPVYDGDLEASEGLPANAKQLKELMKSHEGFLISSPEYNSMPSGALKNALDWASRAEPGEAPLACFKGKLCVLMSASPGALGGLRALPVLRNMLLNIHVIVLPDQLGLMKAHEAFDEAGKLKDPKQQAQAEGLGARLADMLRRLSASG